MSATYLALLMAVKINREAYKYCLASRLVDSRAPCQMSPHGSVLMQHKEGILVHQHRQGTAAQTATNKIR